MRIRQEIATVIALLCLLAGVVFAPAAESFRPSWYEFPLYTDQYSQSSPRVSGNLALWVEQGEPSRPWQDSHSGDIFGYDFRTRRRIPVCTGLGATLLDLSGSRVMLRLPMDHPEWWSPVWTSYGIHDFKTGRESPLSSLLPLSDPAISGKIVVGAVQLWTSDIFAYNLINGRVYAICTAPRDQTHPAISDTDDAVVWVDERNSTDSVRKTDIYGCHLSTGEEFPVSVGAKAEPSVLAVSGNSVVWEDHRAHSYYSCDVYAHDLVSGKEFRMNSLGNLNLNPRVSGRYAVWWRKIIGDPTPPPPYLADVHAYDLEKRAPLLIAGRTWPEHHPDISGLTVVWVDDANTEKSPVDNDIYGIRLDPLFIPPKSPEDPTVFFPYIAYTTTCPTDPAMGEPYEVIVVVRNHGGREGMATVTLRESRISAAGDPADPAHRSDTKPLDGYGEVVFRIGPLHHQWNWAPTAEQYEEFMRAAGGLISPERIRRYAQVAYQGDVSRAFADFCLRADPWVAPEAQYRYDITLDPGTQTMAQLATVTVPRYQQGALLQSVACHLGGNLLTWAGWKDPGRAEALAAQSAVWQWLSRELYRVASESESSYTILPTEQTIYYPELEALPASKEKEAAEAALLHAPAARAMTQSLLRMVGAARAGHPSWQSAQAETARTFADFAQGDLVAVERALTWAPVPLADAASLAAFRADLEANGLPDIMSSFLRARGWTQEQMDGLVTSVVSMPDEQYLTPRSASDAAILQEAATTTIAADVYRLQQDIMPEDGKADTWVVPYGLLSRDGKYVDDMQVRLDYLPVRGDSSPREYSLDGGETWAPYTDPITLSAQGATTVWARGAEEGSGVPPTTRTIFRRNVIFTDVPTSFWAWQNIEPIYWVGIANGYADGGFHPSVEVSRDQMAVFISRALAGGDAFIPSGPATASFADVPKEHWAYKSVEYLKSLHIVQGFSDGYHPQELVDRWQMAVFISRALAGSDAAVPEATQQVSFPDVGLGYWGRKYIEYVRLQGVVTGYPDGLYHPERICTRDQMAVFLQRAFGLPLQPIAP